MVVLGICERESNNTFEFRNAHRHTERTTPSLYKFSSVEFYPNIPQWPNHPKATIAWTELGCGCLLVRQNNLELGQKDNNKRFDLRLRKMPPFALSKRSTRLNYQ